MKDEPRTQDAQAALWNGPAGHAWVEAQHILDRMFKPFEDVLIGAVTAAGHRRVIDVGCGAGGTTLAIARALGATGRATGIDLSEPMIAAARARAEREGVAAAFVCANAQTYAFEPAAADMIVSRFGVMFFDDPIAAFSNLRGAATDDADLRVIVWRSAGENPFMTAAERAAAPLLPNLPARRPDEPGQFAFADERRVSSILQAAGWAAIDIRPADTVCVLAERDLATYLTRLGPVGRALPDVPEPARSRVVETVRAAFDSYVSGADVRFTAACWDVSARAGRSRRR